MTARLVFLYENPAFKSCIVDLLFIILQVLLVNKQDGLDSYKYIGVTLPLFVSLFTLVLMSFSAKGANQCKYSDCEFCD